MLYKMSLLGYVLLLTATLCCTAAPASDGSCQRPERKIEAELQGDWEEESYTENTQAVFQCRPGYSRLGSIKMICLKGKWETFSKGQCKKKSCGHPGDIPFGSFQLSNEDSFVFGAVVQYVCDDGYQMLSKETTRHCTASGWSNYLPHCEVRNCPPVDVADNINVISTAYDSEYSVGQVVRFECKDPKLKLDGPSEIFCTSDGKWNLEPPKCVEITCRSPVVDNGRVLNSRKIVYKNNEVMQYTCSEGFHAKKNGESTCTKDEWNPKPYCEEITCNPYESVEKGKLLALATKTRYKDGDEIDVQCEEGYVLQTEPYKRRECTVNGWFPSTRCVSKKCDRPDILHGVIDSYRDYHYPKDLGRYLYYRCKENYQPNDWIIIYCTNVGWQPEPKCSRQCLSRDAYFENAQLTNLKSVYVEGEKVRFSCYDYYQTPDGKYSGERTCLPNGKFTPAKCSVTCNTPQLQNGKFNRVKSEYETGEFLQYECNKGYMTESRHLSGKAQCRDGNWYEAARCISITCRHNGHLYNDGEIIEYKCPDGQRPESDSGQCYYYGWGPPLSCQDVECTIPRTLNLVRSPSMSIYKFNRKVRFSCGEGFVRFGPLESVCKEGGWNPPLPTCQDVECTIPRSLNLVRSPSMSIYKFNKKVRFSCDKGFVRFGPLESVCKEGGWNPPLPTCQEEKMIQPQTTDQPSDGNEKQEKKPDQQQTTDPPVDDDKKQEKKPDQQQTTDPPVDDDKKQVEIPVEPESVAPTPDSKDKTEKRQKCPIAYSPQNAEIVEPKEVYYSDDTVTMKCIRKYKMYGSPTVRCVEGKWEQPPECIRVTQCLDPPNIENGIIESSKQEIYETDDVVKYSCKLGFHIIGSDQSTCVNEQWSTLPTCTEDACAEAPKILHGTTIVNKKMFYHGERAKYTCENGFRLKGEDSASCIEGRWMNTPVCIETSCKPPPNVQNSKISGVKPSYASGEKVTFVCNPGFSLERSGEAQCENTNWINLPACRRTGEQCGPPPTVQYGETVEIRKANYKTGDTVTFKCPEYYILEGNSVVTCRNGVWNDAPLCIEPCTAKQNDMEENNIQLKWRPDRKLYSRHGDTIGFECKSGFEAPPDTQMRINCEKGKLQYPKCFKRGFCTLQQSTMITNNIYYNISTIVDHGQTILFQCNEGMMSENKLEAKCEWKNINYPKCTAAESCKTPEILNGFLKTGQQASYDSGLYVAFECNEGYAINAAIKVKCENGQWSTLPVCHSPCKISPDELTKHNIQLFPSNDQRNILAKSFKHGTEISVTCKSGFRRPTHAALVTECHDGKFTYPRCLSGSICRIVQDDLDENNLELDDMHDNEVFYSEGEIIQFKCKNGFHYLGQPTGTCSGQKLSYPICTEDSSV